MAWSGSEVTEKGFAQGWDPSREDQGSQRDSRNTRTMEATVFRPFAWDRRPEFASTRQDLRYHYYGGWYDDGAAWAFRLDSFIVLPDEEPIIYIERDLTGLVSAQLGGFTYPNRIPMATVKTSGGRVIPESYVDCRPEVVGPPSGAPGFIQFSDISGTLLPSQINPVICYLKATQVSGGAGGEFGSLCGAPADYWFPADLGVGGPPTLTTAPLQVYGDIDFRGALRFLNGADVAENVIFASGSGDEFAKITNFSSSSTLWGVRSRTGLVNTDDREATLALVRTDNAGNEEITDYYNNGFFSSLDTIAVGHGLRMIRTGLDSDPLRGHWRPYRFDWYHGDTMLEVPGYTIWSPEDPGGPCFEFHIPVKLPFSQQMANDLFLETDLGKFVLSRATSKKPWTPHDRCASNVGFS